MLDKPLADLVLVTVQLLDDFIAGNAGGMRAHGNDFATRRQALLSRARQELSDQVPDEWVRLASLVATVDRLTSDLRGESRLDEDEEAPE